MSFVCIVGRLALHFLAYGLDLVFMRCHDGFHITYPQKLWINMTDAEFLKDIRARLLEIEEWIQYMVREHDIE